MCWSVIKNVEKGDLPFEQKLWLWAVEFNPTFTPEDLVNHQCLAYLLPMTGDHRPWQFSKNGQVISQTVTGALNINNAESLLEAAVAGGGITMISNFIAADALKSGKLKTILPDYIVEGPEVFVVYLPRSNLSAKVKAFIEFLTLTVEGIERA